MSRSAKSELNKLGNSLTVLLGFSELLHSGAYGQVDPRQKRVVRLLFKTAQEASEVFRDVVPLLAEGSDQGESKG